MRYLFFISESGKETALAIDEAKCTVEPYPLEGRESFSRDAELWLWHYKDFKDNKFSPHRIFEICENQFNKFKNQGVKPENWDF